MEKSQKPYITDYPRKPSAGNNCNQTFSSVLYRNTTRLVLTTQKNYKNRKYEGWGLETNQTFRLFGFLTTL